MIALIAIRPIRGKTFILLFEQSPFSQTISFMILPITSSMKCIFTTFLIFEWISLMCWLSAPLILHQLTINAFLRLWLWHRFKSLSLPSWNSSQLDVSDQRRSQVRPSHPAPSDNDLTWIDGLKSCEKVETWNPKNLISEDEVKKLKWHPYRLLPSGKMDVHMDTKSRSRSKIFSWTLNLLVARGGIEPPTHGFSVRLYTN